MPGLHSRLSLHFVLGQRDPPGPPSSDKGSEGLAGFGPGRFLRGCRKARSLPPRVHLAPGTRTPPSASSTTSSDTRRTQPRMTGRPEGGSRALAGCCWPVFPECEKYAMRIPQSDTWLSFRRTRIPTHFPLPHGNRVALPVRGELRAGVGRRCPVPPYRDGVGRRLRWDDKSARRRQGPT